MRALPSDRWRAFVTFYLMETCTNKNKDFRGAQAARKAGFGTPNTRPAHMANMAWRIMRDDRMIAAIAEESRKFLRSSIAPEAIAALQNGVRNPDHKDHGRFVAMALDRLDPIVTRQEIAVSHTHVSADQEALEELRALRQLGTSREKLLELYGGNGLTRLERLEASDTEKRAQNAKVIEGEVLDTSEDTDG
jgi:hypothetical protein